MKLVSVRCVVSGEVLQDANTSDRIFGVRELIAYLSSAMTLCPSDITATGKPSGAGLARLPQRCPVPDETLRVVIDGLGSLENSVVAG